MKQNRKGRKSLQMAFVMDVMEKLYYDEDISVSLMAEAVRRGHITYYMEPKNIYTSGGSV